LERGWLAARLHRRECKFDFAMNPKSHTGVSRLVALPDVRYAAVMLRLFRRKTSTQLTTVAITLLVLLVGQGLRLCLHAPDATDAGPAHATASHLESNLLSPGEPDDSADRHVSLSLAVVKQLTDGVLAILLTVALIWLLPPVRQHFAVSRNTPLLPSGDYRLRPPLRAPPF
jgi:hypothetical protein